MNRQEWMAILAPMIRPRAPLPAATQLGKMLQFLTDIPDHAFTEASIAAAAPRLPRSPSLGQIRAALVAYLHTLDGPPEREIDNETMRERQRLAERAAELQEDWDDPDGIRARIRTCNGEMIWLRMLATLVQRHAPQHLGLLPPAAIASLDEPAPEPFHVGQLLPPRPAYFTPEQLKAAGGTRHATIAAEATSYAAAGDTKPA